MYYKPIRVEYISSPNSLGQLVNKLTHGNLYTYCNLGALGAY